MPIVDVRTSASPTPLIQGQLLEDLATITANLLGKPVEVTMARLQCEEVVYFRGNREPAAHVEVRGIDLPDRDTLGSIAFELTRLLDEVLDIPPARTFVTFESLPRDRWAVDGKLLG